MAGVHEADLNLDIALRLRRMLQAAGMTVVMTRTTDRDVNRPARDRNRDGRIDHKDELIARNDIADLARADLTLNIHNNATECRCGNGTEMFIDSHRPWASSSRALAGAVQRAHVRRLRAFEDRTWHVVDHGVSGSDRYVSLQGYRHACPRPSLMPAILGESLFLDRSAERQRLGSARVRTAIAAAYYDGVVAWLAVGEPSRSAGRGSTRLPRCGRAGAPSSACVSRPPASSPSPAGTWRRGWSPRCRCSTGAAHAAGSWAGSRWVGHWHLETRAA